LGVSGGKETKAQIFPCLIDLFVGNSLMFGYFEMCLAVALSKKNKTIPTMKPVLGWG
jgi:hypothetical protein